jgi:hypothetical protein
MTYALQAVWPILPGFVKQGARNGISIKNQINDNNTTSIPSI